MKKDAVFVFSMSHPIVTAWDGAYDRYTRTETGERLYANLRNYCKEGLRKVDWVVNGYECYHRTVSSLINGLIGAGFTIEECQEAGVDILEELNKSSVKIQILYWLVSAALIVLFGLLTNWKYVWIIGIAAGVLSTPITKAIQKKKYNSLVEKSGNEK